MLRVPSEGDKTAPLTAPLQKIGFSESVPDTREEKSLRSRRRKKEAEVPEWDASSGAWRSSSKSKLRTVKILAAWIGAMGLIVAIVVVVVKLTDNRTDDAVPEGVFKQDQFDDLVGNRLLISEEELEDEVSLPRMMGKSESEFLSETKPLAIAFLEAEKVEDILPLIHEPERVRPLIRSRYPSGDIEPLGMSKFNSSGQISYKDSFAAVTILTPEYETKQLAFIEGKDGLKIDWESWVGWSDIPWKKIMETKPKQPILVRVMVKWVDYYNFGFSDESEWRSYRLVSPDGETTLYGYVDRNSLLDQRLRPAKAEASVAVTLKIHFRKNEQSSNQVVIDELVSDGWVVTNESE